MNAKDLTLIVVAKDEQSMRGFDQTHVNAARNCFGHQLLAATAFPTRKLWLATSRPEIFGLCHADALFGPGALDMFAQTAGERKVCGMVGRSADPATMFGSVHKLHLDQPIPISRKGQSQRSILFRCSSAGTPG